MAVGYKAIGRVAGEFALIVIGVMVALAGDSWLETRSQRGLEREYLERIAVDLERTLQSLDQVTNAMAAIDAHSRAVLPYLRGHASTSAPLPVVASAYHTTRGNFPAIIDDAFVELSLGPGLTIVEDTTLRMDLIDYFRNFDRGNLPGIVISDNIAIRDAVRRVIPAELQIAIREGCPLLAEPLTCDIAVDDAIAKAALDELLADSNVRRSLNLWLQSLDQERKRVSRLQDRGDDLLAALRRSIGYSTS